MDDPTIRQAQSGPMLLHVAERFLNRPLLLHPAKAEVMLHVLQGRLPLTGGLAPLTPESNRFIGAYTREDGRRGMSPVTNGVAIITIAGSLVNRGAWIGADSGLVSYEGISAQLRDVRDDATVRAVILDLDTPGGEATGMFAVAQLVREVAAIKPVIAVVNDMAASAGYGIASACTEIVVSPTSMVGSIGVVLTHFDQSGALEQMGVVATMIYAGAHKVDGHPFGPLPDQVKADLQAEVAKFYDQFIGLVATGRGKRLTDAAARATEARTFLGQDAVDLGLADRVASLDAIIAEFSTNRAGLAPRSGKGIQMTSTTGAAPQAENAGFTQAQVDAARIEGATAERTRIAAILTHAEAAGREAQAQAIALMPEGVSAAMAATMLATSPKADASPVLTIEQRAAALTEAGAGSGEQAPKGAAIDAAWKAALAKVNRA